MNKIEEKIFELEETIYNMHHANVSIMINNRLGCFKDAAKQMEIFNENFDSAINLLAELECILSKELAE